MVFLSSEQLNLIWSGSLVSWIPDSNLQQDSGFLVLDSGFQSPGFRIPKAKNSWIPEAGFPYMGRCVSFNSRSVVNKRLELSSLLALKSYELVAITETFLDSTINSSEIFSDSFNVQRRDRSRHGGGVLLAVHQGLCCIRRTDFETDCEILQCAINVMKSYSGVLVGVFYRPPSSDIDYWKDLYRLSNVVVII